MTLRRLYMGSQALLILGHHNGRCSNTDSHGFLEGTFKTGIRRYCSQEKSTSEAIESSRAAGQTGQPGRSILGLFLFSLRAHQPCQALTAPPLTAGAPPRRVTACARSRPRTASPGTSPTRACTSPRAPPAPAVSARSSRCAGPARRDPGRHRHRAGGGRRPPARRCTSAGRVG